MHEKDSYVNIIPKLWSREDSLWLMQDGGTFYFWNPIAENLALITKPNDLGGILSLLKQKRWPEYEEVPYKE